MNSMLAMRQPARQAMAMPSPVEPSGLLVYRYTLLAPPVASATKRAWNTSTRPVLRLST